MSVSKLSSLARHPSSPGTLSLGWLWAGRAALTVRPVQQLQLRTDPATQWHVNVARMFQMWPFYSNN